jgi:tRNA(fMet)-specific endonuclease VapC
MILDTNTLSALAEGDEKLLPVLLPHSRHHIPVIVSGEYRYGLKRSRERAVREQWLDELEACSDILEVDTETSRYYAQVREELRGIGKPIPENDVWIAALSRQHGLEIVTRDSHFEHVPGIRRISW